MERIKAAASLAASREEATAGPSRAAEADPTSQSGIEEEEEMQSSGASTPDGKGGTPRMTGGARAGASHGRMEASIPDDVQFLMEVG